MPPPINDPIPNQDINMLGTEKDQSLPPQLAKNIPGYKSPINVVQDCRNDSTDDGIQPSTSPFATRHLI